MSTLDHQADHDFSRGMGRGNYNYQDMEAEAPPQPPEQHDLTLGMTALLGIFLAVVLVCAVFFGFGYSTGRTLHGTKASTSTATLPAASAPTPATTSLATDGSGPATQTPPLATAQPIAKPSAGAPISDNPSPSAARSSEEEPGFPPPATQPAVAPSTRPVYAVPAGNPGVAATPTLPNPSAGNIMVQIAAVAHQADADMLARALRANGYPALVRTEPQDNFLHVQVGPFASRDQAKAMRARLQGDGYNAFLKP